MLSKKTTTFPIMMSSSSAVVLCRLLLLMIIIMLFQTPSIMIQATATGGGTRGGVAAATAAGGGGGAGGESPSQHSPTKVLLKGSSSSLSSSSLSSSSSIMESSSSSSSSSSSQQQRRRALKTKISYSRGGQGGRRPLGGAAGRVGAGAGSTSTAIIGGGHHQHPDQVPCESIEDCPFTSVWQYCSHGTCRRHGHCTDVTDCYNPSNDLTQLQQQPDINIDITTCLGPLTCTEQGFCNRLCIETTCFEGSPTVNCIAPPCDVMISDDEECLSESPVSCVNDYCNGCNAIRFNAKGDQVCKSTSFSCRNDKDCPMKEYCSDGICRSMGECANIMDCFNPSNEYPVIACIGPITCQEGLCGIRECSDSSCPEGVPSASCLIPPCDGMISDECLAESPISCVDEYCGGCNAIRFDAAGRHVCTSSTPQPPLPPTPPDPALPIKCQHNDDCPTPTGDDDEDDDYYCSDGYCRIVGTCETVMDCFNPSNDYIEIECVGPITCNKETGLCDKECSVGSSCHRGIPSASCAELPCDDSMMISDECLAELPVSCVNHYCGGCIAIRFDAAGRHVCTPQPPLPPLPEPTLPETCEHNDDCPTTTGDDYYCSDGICRIVGTCDTVMDCFNPSNDYMEIQCVGPITCNKETGLCDKECSVGSSCHGGIPSASCSELPCDDSLMISDECLAESPVSCVNHYCGGCTAIRFDAAGRHVCTPQPPLPPTCEQDGDCFQGEDKEYYCSSGICRPMGRCTDVTDCFNPSNRYAGVDEEVEDCVGPMTCDDNGMCVTECTGFPCDDGTNFVNCFVSPCQFPSLECLGEFPVSCVENYCGGCNAYRFNAAGKSIC